MATWYIDFTNGDDSTGDGTSSSPYKTLSKAHTEATSGDTVEFAAGTYTGKVSFSKNLTMQAASGATVTYNAEAGNSYIFDTGAASLTLTFKGIDADASNLDTGSDCAVLIVDQNSTTVSLTDCDWAGPSGNTDDAIIWHGAGALDLTTTDCDFTVPANSDAFLLVESGATSTSTKLVRSDIACDHGADWFVERNATATGSLPFIMEDCTVTGTVDSDYLVPSGAEYHFILRGNAFINKSSAAQQIGSLVMSHANHDHVVLNNLFYGPRGLKFNGSTGSAVVHNNSFVITRDAGANDACIYCQDAATENALDLDYNHYYRYGGTSNSQTGSIGANDYATLSDWQTATSQEANGVEGDPSYTDIANYDYTLTASSSLINAGAYVGRAYTGSAPDIGPYEYTASVDAGVGIGQLDRFDGTRQLLVVISGTLYEYDPENDVATPVGGGFTPLDTNYWSLISFADSMYCLTEDESLHVWSGDDYTAGTVSVTAGNTSVTGSGTSWDGVLGQDGFIQLDNQGLWHRIASVGGDTSLTLSTAYTGTTESGASYTATTYRLAGGSPPTGSILVKWDNRLWIAGNDTNPRRAYFSALNDGEDWTTGTDFVTVPDSITSMVPLDNVLLLFSEDRAWAVQPIDQTGTPFAVEEFTSVGVKSHWSAARDGSIIMALTEQGVRIINGAENPIISEPVQDTLNLTNRSRWKYAVGLIDKPNHRYLLLLSSSGSSEHDRVFVYDYLNARWDSIDELGVNFNIMGTFEDSNDDPHVYGLGYDGHVYEYETTASSDSGTAISVAVSSGHLDGGDPVSVKRLMEVAIDAASGYTSASLEHLPDGVSAGSGTTSTMTASASPNIAGGRDMVSAFPQAQNIARAWQLRLTHSASEAFIFYGLGVGIQDIEGEDS